MSREPQPPAPLFTQLDITPDSTPQSPVDDDPASQQTNLLQRLLGQQERQNELLDRQNELMEEMLTQLTAQQRQRAGELGQWKQANPGLSRRCREAAESLSKVQTAFLDNLTEAVEENIDHYYDGEFMLNEFVDRFGPRLAHLNGLLQVLSQLGSESK